MMRMRIDRMRRDRLLHNLQYIYIYNLFYFLRGHKPIFLDLLTTYTTTSDKQVSTIKCNTLLTTVGLLQKKTACSSCTMFYFRNIWLAIVLPTYKNLFVHILFRQAYTDRFWALGRGDVSGQIRVLHWRRLLHRLWVQGCYTPAVVLEWTAPHNRRQSQ